MIELDLWTAFIIGWLCGGVWVVVLLWIAIDTLNKGFTDILDTEEPES